MTPTLWGPDADGVRALPGGVTVTGDDDVVTVTLDRPEVKNAQSFATWDSLSHIAETVPISTRMIVLRGAGPDFSAGLDLRQLGDGGLPGEGSFADLLALADPALTDRLATFQTAFSRWRDLPAVVVAVVQGRAIGAGFQLALAADLRIATTGASFTMAEPTLGLVPDLGGTHRLVELVGYARALECCATARTIGADEALAWGLINTLLPVDELEAGVQSLVDQLCSLSAEPVRAVKDLISTASGGNTYSAQLAAERAAQLPLLRRLGGRRD